MWMRRVGVPALWPSVGKVLLLSGLNATFAYAIFSYMHKADVNYLDIFAPEQYAEVQRVECLSGGLAAWPLRGRLSALLDFDSWAAWAAQEEHNLISTNNCTAPGESGEICSGHPLRMSRVQQALGQSLHREDKGRIWDDFVNTSSWLFLILSMLVWVAMLSHDLALVCKLRDFVLDCGSFAKGFRVTFKIIWGCSGVLALRFLMCRCGRSQAYTQLAQGVELPDSDQSSKAKKIGGFVLGILLAPVFAVWSMAVVVPILAFCFSLMWLYNPSRLSRMFLFVLLFLNAIFGLVFTFTTIHFVATPAVRPRYAMTWMASSSSGQDCVCGCVYPLKGDVLLNLVFAGAFVSFKSFSLMFRNLKGLRRAQWAALMSVTFPVPLNVYAVHWFTPSGEPIQHRDAETPVQGEPAYDPFALMDEQPESAFSRCVLEPTPVPKALRHSNQWSAGCCGRRKGLQYNTSYIPEAVQEKMDIEQSEYIGCCGFPCFTGGKHGQLHMPDDEEPGRGKTTIKKTTVKKANASVVGKPSHVADDPQRSSSHSAVAERSEGGLVTDGPWRAGAMIQVTQAFSCLRPGTRGKVDGMDKFGNVRVMFNELGALWIFARHLGCLEMAQDAAEKGVAAASAPEPGRKIVSV